MSYHFMKYIQSPPDHSSKRGEGDRTLGLHYSFILMVERGCGFKRVLSLQLLDELCFCPDGLSDYDLDPQVNFMDTRHQ